MKKTAFLHIGPPKTGTTTIQEMLFANREYLLGEKIFLPNQLNHVSVFKHFSTRHEPSAHHQYILDEFFQALSENYPTYIISSEFFSSFQKLELEQIRDFFSSYNIGLKIVVYIRHPLAIAISAKQEMLKKGFSLKQLEEQGIGMRYSNLITRLLDVFDPENVIFRKFSSAKNFDLIQDFCEIAEISIGSVREEAHRNTSLSLEAALILDAINQHQDIPKKIKQDMLEQLKTIKGRPFVLSANEINKLTPVINFELTWLKTTLDIGFDTYAPEGFTDMMRDEIINGQEAKKLFSILKEYDVSRGAAEVEVGAPEA